jgi:hypothetical protein
MGGRGHETSRRTRVIACVRRAAVALLVMAAPLVAQQPSVVVQTSEDIVLRTVSPQFTIRAFGFATGQPLRVTMRVSENFGVLPPFLVDTTFFMTDSSRPLRIKRALPSGATVYWRALVEAGTQAAISEITGPRAVPSWVDMGNPATPQGIADVRQPLFRWRSPSVDTGPGPWRYDLEVTLTSSGQTVLAASGISDTLFRPPTPLQANTSYRWRITARLTDAPGEIIRESPGSFVIIDPPLPTSTLMYQNFPNPFPSATSFSTCFWFDVGEPGATISLELLDLRGNPVRTIVPAADGQTVFPAGRYGRGIPGLGSNCDNRFVWDGTARDGRPVPPGVYLARFRANGGPPIVRRILFRGR